MSRITYEIADFVCEASFDDVPAKAFEAARRTIVDTMGITLGGSVEQAPHLAASLVTEQRCSGHATVVGMGFSTTPALAALVNGISSDILGFSETSGTVQHHPSVPVLAAAWAVAETEGCTWEEVRLAHVLGVEVASKLGYAVQPGLNIRGWHPVSVLGAFGATVAAGRLLGLDTGRMANALGLAGMNASGTKSGMGTMAKSYSRGRAAENGVVAAQLAARGFTGPSNFVESPDGFLRTFGEGSAGDGISASLGNPFEYDEPGLTLKAYPSCTCAHPAIAGLVELRGSAGLQAGDVVRVHCKVTPTVQHYLRFHDPSNPLEAKYSMQYCCAATLLEGTVTLETFREDKLDDPRLRNLMSRVEMSLWEEVAARGFNPVDMPYATEVTLELRDGRSLVSRQEQVPWSPLTPPGAEALAGKYRDCARRVLNEASVAASLDLLATSNSLDVRTLMRLVGQPKVRPVSHTG